MNEWPKQTKQWKNPRVLRSHGSRERIWKDLKTEIKNLKNQHFWHNKEEKNKLWGQNTIADQPNKPQNLKLIGIIASKTLATCTDNKSSHLPNQALYDVVMKVHQLAMPSQFQDSSRLLDNLIVLYSKMRNLEDNADATTSRLLENKQHWPQIKGTKWNLD